MPLVAGVDSSTQACKVVIRDAETGALAREGRAAHPEATEIHPDTWWAALTEAVDKAGGLDDLAAASVAGQQHGMICLDVAGNVVRPALLWNDTRSAGAAADLIEELGGGEVGSRAWAEAVGLVPVRSASSPRTTGSPGSSPAGGGSRRCAPTAATPAAPATGRRPPASTGLTCSGMPSAPSRSCPSCSTRPAPPEPCPPGRRSDQGRATTPLPASV